MKVGCQKCGAAYSVADEKVVGRKLKLRCKKCGETIQVDGTDRAASAPEPEAPQAENAALPASDPPAWQTPAPSSETAAAWHVAVGHTTQGPYTLEEVAEYYAQGNIVLDTLVFKEGWPDWVQAGEVAELQQAAGALLSHPTPPAIPAIPAAARPPRAAFASRPQFEQPVAMGNDPFGESLALASSPRLSAQDMMSGRHEGTVQFSVDQIRALSAVSAPSLAPVAPARPGYASGGGSGLIDVASLAQAETQSEPFRPISGAEISPLDTMSPVSLPIIAAQQGLDLRTKVFASLAALGFALAGGIGVLAVMRRPAPVAAVTVGTLPVAPTLAALPVPAQPVAPVAAEPAQVAEREAPKAAAEDSADEEAAPVPRQSARNSSDGEHASKSQHHSSKSGSGKHDDKERVAKAGSEKTISEKPSSDKASNSKAKGDDFDDLLAKGPSKDKDKDKDKAVASKKDKGGGPSIDDMLAKDPPKTAKKSGSPSIDDLLDGAVSAKKPAPKTETAEPKNDLPETPSREAMQAAYGKATGKVRSCKGPGVATANVSIAGSGRVSSVEVSGVDGAAKSCVENAVRSTPFPKFQKESMTVKFPFKLPG
jgi:predicted Zn finger-like uncharacterized protein